MRRPRLVVAAFLALIGLAWIGQGTGVIAGSAMSGTVFWAVVGAALVVVAIALAIVEWRRARV